MLEALAAFEDFYEEDADEARAVRKSAIKSGNYDGVTEPGKTGARAAEGLQVFRYGAVA